MDDHREKCRNETQDIRISVNRESSLQIGLEDVRMDLDSVHLAASAVRNYEVVLHSLLVSADENNTVREDPRVDLTVHNIRKRDVFIVTGLAGIIDYRSSCLIGRNFIGCDSEVLAVLVVHRLRKSLICNAVVGFRGDDPSYRTVRILRDVTKSGGSNIKKFFIGADDSFHRIVNNTLIVCLPFLAVDQLGDNNDIAVFFCRVHESLVLLIDIARKQDIEADYIWLRVFVHVELFDQVSVHAS